MEVAADNKIWIWVIFMILSFVYNAWKKKNKARQEEETMEEKPGSAAPPVDFGLEDLISQFEEQYGGGKKEPKVEKVEKRVVHSEVKTMEPQRKRDFDEPVVKSAQKNSEPKPKTSTPKKKSTLGEISDYSASGEDTEKMQMDLDLREMIIAQTILERPKY